MNELHNLTLTSKMLNARFGVNRSKTVDFYRTYTHIQTDRQTDIQTDRQTDRMKNRQGVKQKPPSLQAVKKIME